MGFNTTLLEDLEMARFLCLPLQRFLVGLQLCYISYRNSYGQEKYNDLIGH